MQAESGQDGEEAAVRLELVAATTNNLIDNQEDKTFVVEKYLLDHLSFKFSEVCRQSLSKRLNGLLLSSTAKLS